MNQPRPGASKAAETPEGTPAESDHDLVRRVQDGDARAFRKLFERYHRRAFAVAVGVVKNEEDALDVVQEAFVKVHRNIDKFQGSSSFYTWLYRIVMNASIDQVRRKSKRRDLEFDETVARGEEEIAGDGTIVPRLADGNPGQSALRKELAGAIDAALQTLSESHRAVIVLREIEGMSYEEMSEVLGVPKGTIMSRLFHARRNLQAALAPYLGREPAAE